MPVPVTANTFEIRMGTGVGTGNFYMDQSGDVGINQDPKTDIDLTVATLCATQTTLVNDITAQGIIASESSVRRPIQNDESDTNPIRNIRIMTQAAYDAISPDTNTLYIIE